MINQKLAIGAAIATSIAVVAGVASYYSPYATINSMKKSASDRDAETLIQHIDFLSLRTSIKENLKTQIMKEIEKRAAIDKQVTPSIGEQFVDRMLNPMVDKMVSPEGLSALIENRISPAQFNFNELEKQAERSNMRMGYESPDRFVIYITDQIEPEKEIALILKRHGLDWKLSGIDISKV
jgi:hypothetical protein